MVEEGVAVMPASGGAAYHILSVTSSGQVLSVSYEVAVAVPNNYVTIVAHLRASGS